MLEVGLLCILGVCCCVDAAGNETPPEEAHKQKQATAQRPRPPPAKPVSVAAQLAAARAKVQMEEQKLRRVKAEQQAAKCGFPIQRGGEGRGGPGHKSTGCEEGNATSVPPVEMLLLSYSIVFDCLLWKSRKLLACLWDKAQHWC